MKRKLFLTLGFLGLVSAWVISAGGPEAIAQNVKLYIRTVNQASIVSAASTDLILGTTTSTSSVKVLNGTTQALALSSGSLSMTNPIIYPAAVVITPATSLTPVAGARILNQRLGAIATAAPTAVFVFAQPTASVGKSIEVYNQGASPLQVVPEDGTINVTGAATPFACATQKLCRCQGASSTQMLCQAM